MCPFQELENGAYYKNCKVYPESFIPEWEKEAEFLWDYSEKALKKYTE